MLTSDLVRGRRRGERLLVARPSGERRQRALALAELASAALTSLVGEPREEVRATLRALPCEPRDTILARGLHKLLLDGATFDAAEGPDPRALRQALFTAAAAARLASDTPLDDDAVRAEVAEGHGLTAERLDALLYADLPGTHLLSAAPSWTPEELLDRYGAALEQAVLLRAERVHITLDAGAPEALRRVLRACKFRRLLWQLSRGGQDGEDGEDAWTLTLDGPTSLLRSSTRYGLQLALLLPTLRTCDRFTLEAHVRWGRARTPLTWTLEGGRRRGRKPPPPLPPPDDVARLLTDIAALDTPWTATQADDVIDLPGVGWCVPDVQLRHPELGAVALEVLGYWSREAVWKRVALAEQGLPRPMVFALSERLRVDASVLPEDRPAALYVYKGVMHARRVLACAERAATNRPT